MSYKSKERFLSYCNIDPGNHEVPDEVYESTAGKLAVWMMSTLTGEPFEFSAKNTTPEEARELLTILNPKAYFTTKKPENATERDLAEAVRAAKTKDYCWRRECIELWQIAGNRLDGYFLKELDRLTDVCASLGAGEILNYWDKNPNAVRHYQQPPAHAGK